MSDLAQLQQVDAGAMSRMLDRLVQKGLCVRQRDPRDRRKTTHSLATAGAAAAEQVATAWVTAMRDHLAGLPVADRQTLTTLLVRMPANGQSG